MTLIYFILILGAVVLVHEFGHFIFAKMCGIYVYEFSIGMGPKLFSRKSKKDETVYSLRAIPVGGYVQLAGEEVEDDKNVPKDRKLQAKKPWQRFLVMFFGAGNNFIFAILLLFMVGLIWGVPSYKPVLSGVDINKPAYLAGLEKGDYILEIDGHKISTTDDISMYLQLADKEKPVTFKVKKESGKTSVVNVKPTKEKVDDKETYVFGIDLKAPIEKGFGKAVKYAFVKTGALFKQMFVVIGNLFTGGLKVSSLSGPVGIYTLVGEQSKAGLDSILYLVAFLSINVGFINLLPLPAFDGGRILFLAIEKIKGSPVKAKTENLIHSIGFFLLMALMIYVTFNDIIRLIFK